MKVDEYDKLQDDEKNDIVANLCGWELHDFGGAFSWIRPDGA